MQRGHELVLGVERDLIGPRQLLAKQRGVVSGLDAEAHERALHRIALHHPRARARGEFGVVAQDGGSGRFDQRRVTTWLDRHAVELELAFRTVAGAGDVESPLRRQHGAHRHLVPC